MLAVATGLLLVKLFMPAQAQGKCPPSILYWSELRDWSIAHGSMGETYKFQDNGFYQYRRYGPNSIDEEGQYSIQGDKLVLKPTDGSEKVVQYRIGTEKGSETQPHLFLTYPNGRREFYFGMFNSSHNSRPIYNAIQSGDPSRFPCWAK